MDSLVIEGGSRLRGKIRINGSKNAALPIMAAALLADGPTTLLDVPSLSDITHQVNLLNELGCKTERNADGVINLEVTDTKNCHARYDLVRKMRASICVLGPLLAKRGYARVSMPGGCAIGDRPVDIHLRGLEALGAKIELDSGDIICKASKLVGTEIFLGGNFGSTVLGTANVLSAATLAEGTTVIESAACEPEVVDLANMLNEMGAKITGHGSPRITIEGVKTLKGVQHRVIPDRIEAGTFMVAAAITNGEVTLDNVRLDHLMAALDKLRSIGVIVEKNNGGCTVASARRLEATTHHHPAPPRIPHRPPGPVHGPALHRRRQLRHHRKNLTPTASSTSPNWRAWAPASTRKVQHRHHPGADQAPHRSPGHGLRPPRVGRPRPRRPRRHAAPPPSCASTTSTAATRRSNSV